jgi:hypothetical protein
MIVTPYQGGPESPMQKRGYRTHGGLSMRSSTHPRAQEVTNLAGPALTDRATVDSPRLVVRSKRSKGYNLLKNAGVFLNIVGVLRFVHW